MPLMSELVYRRRVQFAETDMAGVLHFSNYFRLMEECEHAFWRSIGLSVHACPAADGQVVSWPRVAVNCEYLSPARFEDELELRFRITRIGTKSLEQAISITRDGVEIARGAMTTVCCGLTPAGFTAVPIPPDILKKLRGAFQSR